MNEQDPLPVRSGLQATNFLLSLSLIVNLAWFHGDAGAPVHAEWHVAYLVGSLLFFGVHLAVRRRWRASSRITMHDAFSGSLIMGGGMLIAFRGWTGAVLGARLLSEAGATGAAHQLALELHLWLMLLVGVELGRGSGSPGRWRLRPPALFIASFVVLILVGAALLMLPAASATGGRLPFADALFTSVSANCVTGLSVIDTATELSRSGQMLVLALIQLGGLNIILFATFFVSEYARQATGMRDDAVVRELLGAATLTRRGIGRLLARVLVLTIAIEAAGAALLYLVTADDPFVAVFHSVSAFNNAGFSIYPGGFMDAGMSSNHQAQIVCALLIVLGGMGFAPLWELIPRAGGRRGTLTLPTRIAIGSALVLVPLGAGLVYACEVLAGSPLSLAQSLFQSVSARTAGFNTVDLSALSTTTLGVLGLLMFVGGSTGSTAGGVKTSTCLVLLRQG